MTKKMQAELKRYLKITITDCGSHKNQELLFPENK